ncbi:MAG: hypothetical protein U5L96_10720 [Owenweeksia sp.]|nr:hypothetical protein [Owenweeksia sp.]
MLKKILITVLIVVVVLIAGFAGFVQATYDKNYDEEYPVADLKVEADFAMIERGRYLVYGPAHCSHCHVPFEKLEEVEAGKEVPLTGGFDLEIPPVPFTP